MSNQLQITGGAKVRNLEGVITGTTGVLNSLPINGSNGIPQLDVNGKILVSQLPNSVMEYLGTWNAATNTPTLVNGTGNAGDVYLCSVAGTVNFGAGPISFVVSDQVIYSGTIWQKASGTNGTVTSIAVTESGDALTITGSPITTSGTINIGFAGTSAQYVAGNGSLITFPSLTGYVPYTGATADVDLGTNNLKANILSIPSSGGSNQLTAFANTASLHSGSLGLNVFGFNGSNNIYFGKGLSNGGVILWNNSQVRYYTLPDADGTIALTSDIPSVTGYVPYTGATANVNLGTYDLTADVITGATGSFASSGSGNTFSINHSSGSGIALNITKGGSGEGLYINKTSGSGNAATIIGTLNATTLVKSGGTSSQFLMADGSVNTSVLPSGAYLPLSGGTLTGALNGTSATFSSTININTTAGNSAVIRLNRPSTAVSSDILFSTNGSDDWFVGTNALGTNLTDFYFYKYGLGSVLTLASTGAATFSSSITTGGGINLQGIQQLVLGYDQAGGAIINYASNGNLNITPRSGYSTIFTAGSVGIGTSSPSTNLHVKSTSGSAIFRIEDGGGNAVGRIQANAGDGSINFFEQSGYALTFGTSNTERMRITSGGIVLVNNTTINTTLTAGISFQVKNEIISVGTTAGIFAQNRTSSNIFGWYGSTNFKLFNSDIGDIASIAYNTGAYTALSDINKKKDFEDSTIGLNEILGLKPTLFRMKDEEDTEKHLGFIAQEVKEFIPQAYVEQGEFIGLQDRPIIAALVKAIQEQQQQIEELKAKIK